MLPKAVEGLVVERVEGELLVLKSSTNEAHALNEAAGIVFELCDGATTRARMAEEVARRTGLPADESVVDLALAELSEAGLVEVAERERSGVTRRGLIRALALPVAAAALLPVVETVLVPAVSSGAPIPPPELAPPPPPPV
jgi:hypothetical protein